MRSRNPRKKKARDLRRIARSSGYDPSIFDLFHKYHPEVKELEDQLRKEYRARGEWYWLSGEWRVLQNMEYDWVTKVAGHWNALGGAPPAWFRRMHNRLRRARQKAAFNRAWHNDDWDDFVIEPEPRSIRWEWW
jgi:hypothetical protein